jgi:hypothetical protein
MFKILFNVVSIFLGIDILFQIALFLFIFLYYRKYLFKYISINTMLMAYPIPIFIIFSNIAILFHFSISPDNYNFFIIILSILLKAVTYLLIAYLVIHLKHKVNEINEKGDMCKLRGTTLKNKITQDYGTSIKNKET